MNRSRPSSFLAVLTLVLGSGRPLAAAELSVAGIVQTPGGGPLAGARVELVPLLPNVELQRLLLAGSLAPEPVAMVETGAEGRFALRVPGPGLFKVVVQGAGRVAMQYLPLPLVESAELPPAVLYEAAPAGVEAVTPAGGALAGTWVCATSADRSFWNGLKTAGWRPALRCGRLDERGRLAQAKAAGERLDLEVFSTGSAVVGRASGVEGGRIVLPPAAAQGLVVEVRRHDGGPAPGVVISLGELAWPVGETGRDGTLRLSGRPAEPLTLHLMAEGIRQAERLEPGSERATFTLAPARKVNGSVVEAGSGQPLPGALVWPAHDPGSFQITGADGRYRLAAPPAERWWVQAEAPGFQALRGWITPESSVAGWGPRLALTPGATVGGQVVDGQGRPLVGVRLSAVPMPGVPRPASFRPDPAEGRAASDRAGRFALAGLRPGVAYELTAAREGLAPLALRGVRTPTGGGRLEIGRLVLHGEARLAGIVVDQEGAPVAGAEVWAEAGRSPSRLQAARDKREPDARTDARGRFALGGLRAGQEVHLAVRRAGFLPAVLPGVEVPGREPLAVVLRPAERVAGWVFDEAGEPVPEASVVLRPAELPAGVSAPVHAQRTEGSTASDGAGRFVFESVAPGRYEVVARAEGFRPEAPLPVLVPAAGQVEDVRVVLERGAVLTGRVAAASGEPLAGARVLVGEAAGFSDEDGLYQVDGLSPGPVRVEVRHRERGSAVRRFEVRPGENRLDLTLEPGQRIAGRVVDAEGAPVSGARVRLQRPGRSVEVASDAAGGFVFLDVPDGRHVLQGEKAGHRAAEPPVEVIVAGAPVDAVDLVLARGATVAGAIRGLGAEELAGVRVEVAGGPSGQVDYTGRYEIAGLAPGDWQVRAEVRDGSRQAEAAVRIPPGAREVPQDLEFRGSLALAGRVRFAGAPLAAAAVSLAGHDLPAARQVSTRHDGRFRIEDLAPGWYRLEVTHPGELLTWAQDLHLTADEEVAVEIAAARVSGRVVSASTEEPVAEAMVVLRRLLGSEEGGIVAIGTDPQGFFSLARVTEGRYRVEVRKPGYAEHLEELEVIAGADLGPLRLVLAPEGRGD